MTVGLGLMNTVSKTSHGQPIERATPELPEILKRTSWTVEERQVAKVAETIRHAPCMRIEPPPRLVSRNTNASINDTLAIYYSKCVFFYVCSCIIVIVPTIFVKYVMRKCS